MRYAVIALAAVGVVAGTAASAQYYPYPPTYYEGAPRHYEGPQGYYYDAPPRYYRQAPPPGYYGPPPGAPRYYPRGYGDSMQPLGAPVRAGASDPGYEPWRPRRDPNSNSFYCVQAGYTVQDGVCKPGRPY